ncbi:putative TIM9-translocase of the mitochondrial inner membrane [Tilletiaria anomala UBC 951]|uniref:Mitochondrial import inner membrane translocase subunit n=1 Tax=Tilletiaria anomala (strain ATCC 24038 / CBS 436.72 / UBC 951) TaxID=1037660 RepID=A0A066WKQ1_TILAU|nr:putative TIM9-translocase of the mitochondrial inner membrane [Tilletiaria anomala UBC 951]KDN53158.1 putative TIM9-translocase of the mitochondrial inner membrane [Tilletiaria anomala UBC 951]
MDFSHMSSAEQAGMARIIEQKQMKDFMQLYTNLVERCFNNCCNDFTSRALTTKEDKCIEHCTLKFLKHAERVGARFAEENAKLMSSQQPPQ